ncbi:MAG: hypothetical protein DMG14_06360 [Acidobacteria bacterium]|nr:MAG: hypothetical protein DMG14_06360 [Acidobacteriota bacterium]
MTTLTRNNRSGTPTRNGSRWGDENTQRLGQTFRHPTAFPALAIIQIPTTPAHLPVALAAFVHLCIRGRRQAFHTTAGSDSFTKTLRPPVVITQVKNRHLVLLASLAAHTP